MFNASDTSLRSGHVDSVDDFMDTKSVYTARSSLK